MPYIHPTARSLLQPPLSELSKIIVTPGELNYAITKLCLEFLQQRNATVHYAALNEIIGVLESAKLEFYRRQVSPYEDTKIATHGDVYPEKTDV